MLKKIFCLPAVASFFCAFIFVNDALTQPNDGAIDSKDHIYVSDPNFKAGAGHIWRVDTDASPDLRLGLQRRERLGNYTLYF